MTVKPGMSISMSLWEISGRLEKKVKIDPGTSPKATRDRSQSPTSSVELNDSDQDDHLLSAMREIDNNSDEAHAMSDSALNDSRIYQRCEGQTREGDRCRMRLRPGSRLCHVHFSQERSLRKSSNTASDSDLTEAFQSINLRSSGNDEDTALSGTQSLSNNDDIKEMKGAVQDHKPFSKTNSEEGQDKAVKDTEVEKPIPPGARWTKMAKALVSPQALEEAGEPFEEQPDSVLVLRALTKAAIQSLAEITKEVRERRCRSCNRSETSEWRPGPDGARTLCDACGLRKSRTSELSRHC